MKLKMEQLQEEMGQLGRPVTKRRLVDWIQKGLLPPPVHKGLGRGKGSEYFWTQSNLLSQAVKVFDLLEWHGRVSGIVLPLWLMGYEVPVEVVRSRFLEPLDETLADLKQQATVGEEIADVLSGLALHYSSRMTKLVPLSNELYELMLCIFLDPEFDFERWEDSELIKQISTGGWLPTSQIHFVSEHFSLSMLREGVVEATEEQFHAVQTDIRTLIQCLQTFKEVLPSVRGWEALEGNLTVGLGFWIALIDFSLRRQDKPELIERQIHKIVNFCQRMATDHQIARKISMQARNTSFQVNQVMTFQNPIG